MRLLYKRAVTSLLVVILALGGLLATPQPAQAAGVIFVDIIEDQYNGGETDVGPCSLREAITAANTGKKFGGCTAGTTGADKIYLPNLGNYYRVDRKNPAIPNAPDNEDKNVYGDLDITSSISFIGDWAINPATGDAATAVRRYMSSPQPLNDRIFHIIQPSGKAKISVSFNGMAIRSGMSADDGKGGGGILNEGANVNLYRVVVEGNNSLEGAGINNKGNMSIKDSAIINNTTNGAGGGIFSYGNLKIENSLIFNNAGTESGGGIDSRANEVDSEKTVIRNSTIANNQSDAGAGAGIANSGPLELYHVTIYRNTGLGIQLGNGSKLWMANSILANNFINDSTEAECMVAEGATAEVFSLGGNLVEDDPLGEGGMDAAAELNLCIFNPSTDILDLENNTQFLIAESITYGRYTGAYELLEGSPTIDFIDSSNEYCPIFDQFFNPRPWDYAGQTLGGGCDIGAHEQGSVLGNVYILPFVLR